jgi:transcriptional regulator with XRE-family HTH domain
MQPETDAQEQTPQDAVVLALARGCSQREAAEQAGCHRTSITRWLREAEFRERVSVARREILAQATGKLGDRILSAIDTLTDLLQSENDAVKLGAARCLLQSLLPLRESEDFAERLSKLEGTR